MNQRQSILNHMQTRGPITPIEALQEYGCFRLGARIWDLKQDGWPISAKMITMKGKHFAQYRLKGGAG